MKKVRIYKADETRIFIFGFTPRVIVSLLISTVLSAFYITTTGFSLGTLFLVTVVLLITFIISVELDSKSNFFKRFSIKSFPRVITKKRWIK